MSEGGRRGVEKSPTRPELSGQSLDSPRFITSLLGGNVRLTTPGSWMPRGTGKSGTHSADTGRRVDLVEDVSGPVVRGLRSPGVLDGATTSSPEGHPTRRPTAPLRTGPSLSRGDRSSTTSPTTYAPITRTGGKHFSAVPGRRSGPGLSKLRVPIDSSLSSPPFLFSRNSPLRGPSHRLTLCKVGTSGGAFYSQVQSESLRAFVSNLLRPHLGRRKWSQVGTD